MKPIEEALVSRAVSGDAAAVREVVQALSGPFHALALRMLNHHADAEDATQEALLRVVTRLSTFDGRARFTTWAFRVAVRRILDHADGRARRPMLSFDAFAEDLSDGLDPEAPMPDDRIVLQQLKLGCGRALLQCLDGDHRAAYVLGEILEFEGPECAAMLGIPPATFRKRLSRARGRIRTHLRGHCGVVSEQAACRCERRHERAGALGRLAERDRDGDVDVVSLSRLIRSLPALDRAAAYYRGDPSPGPRGALVDRVLHAVGAA